MSWFIKKPIPLHTGISFLSHCIENKLHQRNMPKLACSVVGCTNNTDKLAKYKKEFCEKHRSAKGTCGCPWPYRHFPFPTDVPSRKIWIKLVNRKNRDNTAWQPPASAVVCSAHFVDGQPTVPNPAPTLKLGYVLHSTPPTGRIKNRVEKQQDQEVMMTSSQHPQDIDCEDWLSPATPDAITGFENVTDIEDAVETNAATRSSSDIDKQRIKKLETDVFKLKLDLRTKTKELSKHNGPIHKQILKTDEDTQFYTSIPTRAVFLALVAMVGKTEDTQKKRKPSAAITAMLKAKYKGRARGSTGKLEKMRKDMVAGDRVLLTLMKLRLGLLHQDLARRFGVSTKKVSTVFRTMLPTLSACLRPLIIFYTRQEVRETIPNEYGHYKGLRCIVDCTEFFIEKPLDFQLQAATWSDYKHHNTAKLLVAITPQGSICYVSEVWGGRASDRHIVAKSSFLSYINPGDIVMADRGFTIKEMLNVRGADTAIPPASKGHAQMTEADVAKTKKVANVRIHVERVIQRMKQFRLLSQVIPISILDLIDDIVIICSAITNMKGPIVKTWTETKSTSVVIREPK